MIRQDQTAPDKAEPLAKPGMEGDSYIFPLSFAQQRLWFLEQLESGSSAYNICDTVQIKGNLNLSLFERCLNEITRRHEILRTIITSLSGEAVQIVKPHLEMSIPCIDLGGFSSEAQAAEIRRLAMAEEAKPFNLSEGPLFRVVVLRINPAEHIMLLVFHHIVTDEWSLHVFYRELSVLYTAFERGEASPLADLPLQYADYAVWQRDWLQGETIQRYLDYWRKQLDNASNLLRLPTDHPRPAIQTSTGASFLFSFSKTLSKQIVELGHRVGATPYMVLLAAFKVLLLRYIGQTDIVVGSPIAGRTRPEIEDLIGFFVNTLVLRSDLSGNPNFLEILRRVKQVALDAYTYQDLPFEKLVEELQPPRDFSLSPLFQVLFDFHNAPVSSPQIAGLTLTRLNMDNQVAKFDLTFEIAETDEGLKGEIEYNLDLFEPGTIQRMAGHFENLLQGIVVDPDQHIADLPILAEAERRQLLVEWNDTKADYPCGRCIHELFEAQVERMPETVAVVFEDQCLTYAELNRRANQLAHYLQKQGVGPEVLVGICVERSLEMVVGLLGILKAGGAYVPLDPTYPRERLVFMLENAEAPLLLTQEALRQMLSAHAVRAGSGRERMTVCLDADWEIIARQDAQNLVSGIRDDNLAYVIYTSGSTGKPKGVMNTHSGIRNRLLWMQQAYQLEDTDRVVQKTPFSFDVSVWEFFWPLLNGACLVVARPEGHKDSAYLVEKVIEEGVTTMHFVPSMLQAFVAEREVEACGSLRRIICSGEALSYDLQGRFFAKLRAELHNLYGPTEAAVDVTFWACERKGERHIVPIGRPIANTQIYILDAHLQPTPVGVPGELHIGGVGLARGYHKQPGLTAHKFIPHPFTEKPGARLYCTGDLARYLPDGSIEYLSRIDHQVKIRGFRIELGEIEHCLAAHPAIKQAVVACKKDPAESEALCAYLVLRQQVDISEVKMYLADRLPQYMVPAYWIILEKVPLTPNGKIDVRSLPGPSQALAKDMTNYEAPESPLEQALAAIWESVLKLERVGVNDNFFEIGGHSLNAVQVANRAGKVAQMNIPVRMLFLQPTIRGLARSVEQAKAAAESQVTLDQRIEELSEKIERLKAQQTGDRVPG